MGRFRKTVRRAAALLVALGAAACAATVPPPREAVAPARTSAPESADFAATFDVGEHVTDAAFTGWPGCDDRVMSGSTVRHVAARIPDGSVYEIWVRRAQSGTLQHIEVRRGFPNEPEQLGATLVRDQVHVVRGTTDVATLDGSSALAAVLHRVGDRAEALRCANTSG